MIRGYKTSKDYHRLKELLDKGYEVVVVWRDSIGVKAAVGRKQYYHPAFGVDYTRYCLGPFRFRWDCEVIESFEHFCSRLDIEFIEPEEEE